MNKTCFFASLPLLLIFSGCVSQKTYDRDMGVERQLNQQLSTEIAADRVKITQLQDRLKVTMEDQLLFPEGGYELHSDGKKVLDRLVQVLQNTPGHRIEAEGNTDSLPIGVHLKHRFATNWELSTARATEVVKYLQSRGIDPKRLTAAGHGEYQPVAPNTTPEGRQANRRTDIDLVPIYNQ